MKLKCLSLLIIFLIFGGLSLKAQDGSDDFSIVEPMDDFGNIPPPLPIGVDSEPPPLDIPPPPDGFDMGTDSFEVPPANMGGWGDEVNAAPPSESTNPSAEGAVVFKRSGKKLAQPAQEIVRRKLRLHELKKTIERKF